MQHIVHHLGLFYGLFGVVVGLLNGQSVYIKGGSKPHSVRSNAYNYMIIICLSNHNRNRAPSAGSCSRATLGVHRKAWRP